MLPFDRLTAPSSVEGWFENLTTLRPVDGPLHGRSSVICFLLALPLKNKQWPVIDLAAQSARCYEHKYDS